MRQKSNDISPSFNTDEKENADDNKTLKIVLQFRDEYKRIDEYLQKYPEILDAVHRDLKDLCKPDPTKNRTPDFTSENLFRAILVMQIEAIPYREATIRIAESKTLQAFCRLEKKETINHSLICAAYKALSPETWETINQCFALRMKQEGKISTENIRVDTTVVETNIHYPTDASLLWDVYRTIDRLWNKALDLGFGPILPLFRFHIDKFKKLYLNVTRNSSSKDEGRKKLSKKGMGTLIDRTAKALEKAKQIAECLAGSLDEHGIAISVELSSLFPAMEKVIDAAQRRHNGEKVPVEDKVFSIFEPHTELLMRGKWNQPIELGHLINLSQTREKFISDYQVFEKSPSDKTLLPETVDRHEELFGEYPMGVASDRGFYPGKEKFEDLLDDYEGKVEYWGVPSCLSDFGEALMTTYQRWRAGIEGTISCLKRAFRLSRCHFKGFKNFCSAIGSAIFCHNLRVMVHQDMASE